LVSIERTRPCYYKADNMETISYL